MPELEVLQVAPEVGLGLLVDLQLPGQLPAIEVPGAVITADLIATTVTADQQAARLAQAHVVQEPSLASSFLCS